MPVLSAAEQPARAIAARWRDPQTIAAVVLCAAWCDTCGQFRASLERIAEARADMLFVWLDIEDDSDVCGDIDVENFPTLAIYRGGELLHFGTSLPHEGSVARLIDAMRERTVGPADAPIAVLELPSRLVRGHGAQRAWAAPTG